MIRISAVKEGSQAEQRGLRPGDEILSISGLAVRDLIDLHFHASGRNLLPLEVKRGSVVRRVRLRRDPGEPLGLDFHPGPIQRCGNRCVFCFIDQNPPGMRPSIYVKDEDYRLSFLHGNFVTLSNIKDCELHRILEQRLSPLYVSVHSLNPDVRRRMLCPAGRADVRPILEILDRAGIRIHAQVVLVPGYNGGRDLEQTVEGLASYRESVVSAGIVPVGLTRHRKGLPRLRPVSSREALRLFERIEPRRTQWRRERGAAFAYLADELYLMAGRPLPPESDYDGYPQIENGIGLVRRFTTRLSRVRRVFRDTGGRSTVTLVSGRLFVGHLERLLREKVSRTGEGVKMRFIAVPNRFFGRRVTVAGLLTGEDIAACLRGLDLGDRVVIPPSTLNADGLFLDGMSLCDLQSILGVPVCAGLRDEEF